MRTKNSRMIFVALLAGLMLANRMTAQELVQNHVGKSDSSTGLANTIVVTGNASISDTISDFEAHSKLPGRAAVVTPQDAMNVNESPDSSLFSAAPIAAYKLDSLYQLAHSAATRDDWGEVLFNLHKIRRVQTGYRDVDQLFGEARAKLLATATTNNTTNAASLSLRTPFLIGGTAIVMMIGLIIGFFLLSPMGRARLQRWRGNDNIAALIYESLLARRPSRTKLYPAIAEIYLKMNRRDEAALQIYRRVLELNLPSPYRNEMNAIVALKTVYEKATNGEIIAKPGAFASEEMKPGSSVLLTDDGFQVKEKSSPRRLRNSKKEVGSMINEATVHTVAKNEATVTLPLAPVKPRRPRQKKESTSAASSNDALVINGEPLLSATVLAKKPRRPKVGIVDSIHIAETTADSLDIDDAVAARLLNLQPTLIEASTSSEPAVPRAEMSAA